MNWRLPAMWYLWRKLGWTDNQGGLGKEFLGGVHRQSPIGFKSPEMGAILLHLNKLVTFKKNKNLYLLAMVE
jgi:hypothetical protein